MRTKLTELREQLDKASKALVSLDTSKPGALEAMRALNCEQKDGDGRRLAAVGTADAQRLHIQLVEQSACDLFEVCDADSQIWLELFEAFLTRGDGDELGFYKPDYQECCTGDVLLIQDIHVDAAYKDRGVEMAIARRIIETLGVGCDLLVYWYGNQIHELELLKPLGFHKSELHEFGFFENNYRQPLVDELQDEHHHGLCRFETEDTADDNEVVSPNETDPAQPTPRVLKPCART